MKSRRTTQITFETVEILTIRQSAGSVRIPCPQCGSLSAMVTLNEAAVLSGVGVRVICQEIEAGRLHFHETTSGSVHICLDSLQKATPLHPGNSILQINRIPTNLTKENPS